jgi:hypothetical protein
MVVARGTSEFGIGNIRMKPNLVLANFHSREQPKSMHSALAANSFNLPQLPTF